MKNTTTSDNRFVIDLQLFADGDAAPGVDAGTPTPAPVAVATPTVVATPTPAAPLTTPKMSAREFAKDYMSKQAGQAPVIQTAAIGTPAALTIQGAAKPSMLELTPEFLSKLPDKFKSGDALKDLPKFLEAYVNIEKMHSPTVEKTKTLEATLATTKAELDTLKTQAAERAANEEAVKIAKESMPKGLSKEEQNKWLEGDFYENPVTAIDERIQAAIQAANAQASKAYEAKIAEMSGKLAPILQKEQEREAVAVSAKQISAFKALPGHGDFDSLRPQMQTVMEQFGAVIDALPDAINPVEVIYNMAKATALKGVDATKAGEYKTLDDHLKDPEAVKKLAGNEAIRQLIMAAQVQAVKDGKPPIVITGGGTGTGAAPVSPPQQIHTIRDATRAAKADMRARGLITR